MKTITVLLVLVVVLLFVATLPSEGVGILDALFGGLLVLAGLFGPLAIVLLVNASWKVGR